MIEIEEIEQVTMLNCHCLALNVEFKTGRLINYVFSNQLEMNKFIKSWNQHKLKNKVKIK